MDNQVTGLFALGGTIVGVLLEPVKALFTSRARTRQVRSERCAEIIRTATLVDRDVRFLNFQYRSRAAGRPMVSKEETEALVMSLYSARTDLRLAASLLRLHGPDKLADYAEKVIECERALYRVRDVPDEGPYQDAEIPPALLTASQNLLDATKEFGALARKWTR